MRLYGNSGHVAGRLTLPISYRVKGNTIVPPVAGGLWSSWPWASWVKPQIDLAASMGANTLSIKNPPTYELNAGTATRAAVAGRYRQLLDYTASLSIKVYGCIGQGDGAGASLSSYADTIAYLAGILDPYQHVIGIDGWNEINIFNSPAQAAAASTAATLQTAVRSATTIPFTISVSNGLNNGTNTTWLSLVAPYCDYLDFHPYADATGALDLSAYRAQSWWKPFIVGEAGSALTSGSSTQTAFYNHLALYSREIDCYGVLAFSVADYESSSRWGAYDENLANGRSQILTPFAAWPTT